MNGHTIRNREGDAFPICASCEGAGSELEENCADRVRRLGIHLRPSALPKLAQCPKFIGSPFAGSAANRGTLMDEAFREGIVTGTIPPLEDEEAMLAVIWAVTTAQFYARGSKLEARECELEVEPGNGIRKGTADLLCEDECWSADLKSGQIRNYMEQQRAYAIGFMERFFVDEWTVYLLFCDERTVVTLKFTREEAQAEQRSLVASVRDSLAVATPCDYCDWCLLRWKCPQKLESVAWFLGMDPATIDLTEHARDAEKVGPLLALTHDIAKDDGVHDMLKAGALSLVASGTPVKGWRMQNGRESKTVAAMQLGQLVDLLGADRVLAMMGSISATKFTSLWEQAKKGEPIPEGLIQISHGSAFLVKAKAKKTKETKTKETKED
jgi:hypothetical protein